MDREVSRSVEKGTFEKVITSEEDGEFEFSEINEEIAVSAPSLGEVKEAAKGLKNGTVPGIVFLKANVKFSETNTPIDDKDMDP